MGDPAFVAGALATLALTLTPHGGRQKACPWPKPQLTGTHRQPGCSPVQSVVCRQAKVFPAHTELEHTQSPSVVLEQAQKKCAGVPPQVGAQSSPNPVSEHGLRSSPVGRLRTRAWPGTRPPVPPR